MKKTKNSNVLTLENLQEILQLIKRSDAANSDPKDGYTSAKTAIRELFENTDDKNPFHLRARLGLIDDFYSTQMNRRYFGIDDLADAILALDKVGHLKDKFINFAKDGKPDAQCFDLPGNGNLWSKTYGIGKDGEEKGIAIALISKFAYFWTGFQFPIYDSIVCEVIPKVYRRILKKDPPRLQVKNKNQKIIGDETIVAYVRAINQLRTDLGEDEVNFDSLDRILWVTGKMMRGNYSLIFSKKQYKKWTQVWEEKAKEQKIPEELWFSSAKNGKSDHGCIQDSIKHVVSDDLTFLGEAENEHLKRMYELAQALA